MLIATLIDELNDAEFNDANKNRTDPDTSLCLHSSPLPQHPAPAAPRSGKLRLLNEGAPMSFVMEQASGLSTTETQRVIEIAPVQVYQRVPIIMGSKNDVQEVIDAYSKAS